MQQQHNARIQFPHAPCVIVNKDAAFPMELLKIAPHQLMKRPVPPELTPEVLNFSTQKPDDRISQITRGFQVSGIPTFIPKRSLMLSICILLAIAIRAV